MSSVVALSLSQRILIARMDLLLGQTGENSQLLDFCAQVVRFSVQVRPDDLVRLRTEFKGDSGDGTSDLDIPAAHP